MKQKDTKDITTKYFDSKKHNTAIILSLVFIIVTLVFLGLFYRFYRAGFNKDTEVNTYDRYYVMINDSKSSIWEEIYRGAYEDGINSGVYVDQLGRNLPTDYSKADLMKIAIYSGVDGIIVDADESEEMTALIDEALNNNIPVVTLIDDNVTSQRCSFIGVGGYNIGHEYGNQIADIVKIRRQNYFMETENAADSIDSIDVAVLVDSSRLNSGQNIIISGLREQVTQSVSSGTAVDISVVSVDNSSAFSAEESIRDMFISGEIPDVIVCFDELCTTCVYQAVVDYNMVGEVEILGYYESELILNAINRGAIRSTITVDASQLGKYCVEALNDYNNFGTTSEYYVADTILIDRQNAGTFMKKEETDD